MAIQNRRGNYSDFDPSKMVEGEFAVVKSGDPNTDDGTSVYISTATGTAKRVALYQDIVQEVQGATQEIAQDLVTQIETEVADDVTAAQTAATNAQTASETATQKAQAASESAEQAAGEVQSAITDLKADLEQNYAQKDGVYPDLAAGIIATDKHTSDAAPYLFRPTGGSKDVGNREYVDAIVGGTVVENQLVQNGNFADGTTGWSPYNANNASISVSNNVLTATFLTEAASGSYQYGVATEVEKGVAGHKYLVETDIYVTSAGNYAIDVNGSTSGRVKNITSVNTWVNMCFVYNAVENPARSFLIEPYQKSIAVGDTMSIRNVMLIDLTQMFGATIADYLYSLETATAGAGIAKLREWGFDIDTYHEYNPGSLESVSGVSAHETVGFNQWDEEWEVGSLKTTDGSPERGNKTIRSKNFCRCLPNTSYFIKCGDYNIIYYIAVYWYDENQIFIRREYVSGVIDVSPANAHYFKIVTNTKGYIYGATYNHDICINLSDPSRNGEYEPYKKNTYPLDSSLTLRGIPKLSEAGDLYYDGDRYLPDGTVERRYKKIVIDGNSAIRGGGYGMPFIFDISDKKELSNVNDKPNGIADKLIGVTQASTWGKEYTFSFTQNSDVMYFKLSDGITTFEDAKAWLASNPITMVYELATPTTETADPYTSYQECDPDGTEEYVTTGDVPVGHETKYPLDLVRKIEDLYGIPTAPTTAGTYTLKAVVTSSGVEYQWVSG